MKFSWKKKKVDIDERDFSLHSGERQTGCSLDDVRFDHLARYQYVVDYLAANVHSPENLFGLDAFCATGYGAFMLTQRLRCPVIGIDASDEAISHGNTYFASPYTFYVNKTYPFHLPKNAYDFITCMESLEHIEDQMAFLTELAGSLKSNGDLFISTPNEELYSLKMNPNKFHYKHYTKDEALSLFEEMGVFTLVDWFGQNIYETVDAVNSGLLADEQMKLNNKKEGQILLFHLRKLGDSAEPEF